MPAPRELGRRAHRSRRARRPSSRSRAAPAAGCSASARTGPRGSCPRRPERPTACGSTGTNSAPSACARSVPYSSLAKTYRGSCSMRERIASAQMREAPACEREACGISSVTWTRCHVREEPRHPREAQVARDGLGREGTDEHGHLGAVGACEADQVLVSGVRRHEPPDDHAPAGVVAHPRRVPRRRRGCHPAIDSATLRWEGV